MIEKIDEQIESIRREREGYILSAHRCEGAIIALEKLKAAAQAPPEPPKEQES